MTTCTFAGHREVYQSMIDEQLKKVVNELLLTDSEFVFYTGGMGEFDNKCSSAVQAAKHRYPHLKIVLVLVLPYMSNKLNTHKEYYESCYDEIIIPAELCSVHYKAAIQKRNQWMVDRSDCLIAYTFREFGGAFQTVKYAQRMKKKIINLAVC